MPRQATNPQTSSRRPGALRLVIVVACLALLGAGLLFSASFTGCPREAQQPITLATTAAVNESGLLDVLLPMFRKETGIEVRVVPSGSFRALELGRKGEADVLLVAEPWAEDKFMKEGHGSARQPVMVSHFSLLGPKDGPVPYLPDGRKGVVPVAIAFKLIADAGDKPALDAPPVHFLSHNDEAGLVRREVEVWKQAGKRPKPPWHADVSPDKGDPLRLADEQHAYILTDRPPALAQKVAPHLHVISRGDQALTNPHSVILVNPDQHQRVHGAAARKFADFLRSPAAQKAIADFRVEQDNRPFFYPSGSLTLN